MTAPRRKPTVDELIEAFGRSAYDYRRILVEEGVETRWIRDARESMQASSAALTEAIETFAADSVMAERVRWADYMEDHKDDLAMGSSVERAGGWFDACTNAAAAIRGEGKP